MSKIALRQQPIPRAPFAHGTIQSLRYGGRTEPHPTIIFVRNYKLWRYLLHSFNTVCFTTSL